MMLIISAMMELAVRLRWDKESKTRRLIRSCISVKSGAET
ncbi:hypothetical protein BSU04_25325 [Caballeronia sordidicola]|uniref:Uncharacterized protein n=1 Tax=Caballeronia sordidicola TaxID=196367 RepID=A0A226WYQ6_CABSO|nr:hypothetical protein BSU04_25325 [Caballeronia sordidicola]